jgi:calcium-translocating P-type ATPase
MAAVQAGLAESGLSSAEAAARLEAAGPNRLPVPKPPPAWHQLAAQMYHFFALMLWVGGALAFLAGLPALGIAIFVVILGNGVFAFFQEHRAERAAARLRDLLPRRATVVRDGRRIDINADELVVEDLVVLEGGDRISADLTVVVAHALSVDTSTLTGESVPESVDRAGALFAGTFVVEGEAEAVVTAIGRDTRLAAIAALTRAGHRPRTPLARELGRVVRIVAAVALAVGVGFFGLAFLIGIPASDGFLFAIGVTVALVPEGLLPAVTLSLAAGAQRMVRRNALVRRLEAVETLGSTTFICTDKTGTLTCNEMSVVDVWTPDGSAHVTGSGYEPTGEVSAVRGALPALHAMAVAGARCSNGYAIEHNGRWAAQGDPMEAALDVLSRRLGVDVEADRLARPEGRRFPFDPRRRRMSVVVGGDVVTKGAPDAVMPRCLVPEGAVAALQEMTERGLRVLAIAGRSLGVGKQLSVADDAETGLDLLGLVGLEDPPRRHAAAAVAACRKAGIRVGMVTGDHPFTARAIAGEVGLLTEASQIVLGRELPADEDMLGALVDRDGIVVARVTPEAKVRIARALRNRGHVVAMTGDGVNDGPALQEADTGVAMGRSGTDVAREAADVVLLDDDFATIVAAVEQGRATFANIRRFLTHHLSVNVVELTPFLVWALSGGRFPLALGVLQVISLDVVTDIVPSLALGTEPARHALDGPPPRRHLLDGRVMWRAFAVLGPAGALAEMAAFLASYVASGWRPGDAFAVGIVLTTASGAAFTAAVIGQAANAFACRSVRQPPWRLGWFSNRLLVWATLLQFVLLAALLFISPLASLLDQSPPSLAGFAVALTAAPLMLAADAAHKAWRARARMAQ